MTDEPNDATSDAVETPATEPGLTTPPPPETPPSAFQPQTPPPPGPPPPPPNAGGSLGGSNWYENVAIIVLALLCCAPLGLVLVWLNKTWSNKTKIIVTAVIVGFALLSGIIGAISGGSSSSSSPKPPATTATPETTTTTVTPEQLRAGILRAQEYACAEGERDATGTYKRSYESSWSSVITAADFYAAIDSCVQERRAAAAQVKEAEFANAGGVDVDAIVKDPDAYTGTLFKFVVEITQYDAATGKCVFRGYWDNSQHRYNFEYAGDNALFSSGNGVSVCPILNGIDANDVVRVWARSTGSFSYSTQIGGSTTVPSFSVEKAEVIQKK